MGRLTRFVILSQAPSLRIKQSRTKEKLAPN